MAAKSLTFDIFGKDKTASKSMNKVGKSADSLSRKFKQAGKGMARGMGLGAIGVAAAAAGIVTFGKDSVQAFSAAQKSEADLQFALKKFPKTAKINIKVLQEYNKTLMMKTRFDDDAVASGQAVLAGFDLNEKQLREMTPLLLDYAARTGKDLPTAAKVLGKALLGQGRGLKELGINFKDQKDPIKNYEQLMGALRDTVGGFAEKDATTAAGKLDILKNRFGEVQEEVGSALMPALDELVSFAQTDLMPFAEGLSTWFKEEGVPGIKDVTSWIVKWKDVLIPAAGALGVLTAAQWALNVAMDANPVGLVILGLGALIALSALVATGWEDMGVAMQSATGFLLGPIGVIAKNWKALEWNAKTAYYNVSKAGANIILGIANVAQGVVNRILSVVGAAVRPINELLQLLNLPSISLPSSVNFTSNLSAAVSAINNSKPKKVSGTGMGMAYSGMGEGRYSGSVTPSSAQSRNKGGNTYIVHGFVGSESKLAQELNRIARSGRISGAV